MEDWQNVVLDDSSMWPSGGRVELPTPHSDDRGAIQSLVNLPMKNVSLIATKKGAVRANHHHVTDWHYMYVLKGAFDYYWRPAGSDASPSVLRVVAGDMIFTPPMEDHATLFLEDTEMLVASRNPRDQETYEADVRRVPLLDPASVVVR